MGGAGKRRLEKFAKVTKDADDATHIPICNIKRHFLVGSCSTHTIHNTVRLHHVQTRGFHAAKTEKIAKVYTARLIA